MANFETLLTAEKAKSISDYVATKTPLTVISQSPAPGTPLIEGMTVEVKATSLNDIPWFVIDTTAPPALRGVPIADVQHLLETNALVLEASRTGDVSEEKRAEFVVAINQSLGGKGLSGEIATSDALAVAKSLKTIGLVRG
ncbi:MAG: PASTA domain-containing protein [Gemmatimonadota bacterium]